MGQKAKGTWPPPSGERGAPRGYIWGDPSPSRERSEETVSRLPFRFTAGSGSTCSRLRLAELSSETLAELVLASFVPDVKQFKMGHEDARTGGSPPAPALTRLSHPTNSQNTHRRQLWRTHTQNVPLSVAVGSGEGRGAQTVSRPQAHSAQAEAWSPHGRSQLAPPPPFPEPSPPASPPRPGPTEKPQIGGRVRKAG